MKTPDSFPPKIETPKNYRIEHLPDLDVVINLNYPFSKDNEIIINYLKTFSPDLYAAIREIQKIKSPAHDDKIFHVKYKKATGKNKGNIDFLAGRTEVDPISFGSSASFGNKSRYAISGVMNEIVLSKKVKEIIKSNEVQSLLQNSLFSRMDFSEPILGLIDKKTEEKYLVYRNVEGKKAKQTAELRALNRIAVALKAIFESHGIDPVDLKPKQFLVSEKDGEKFLTLLDIEAYTEKTTDSRET